jgi:hypothetical protein
MPTVVHEPLWRCQNRSSTFRWNGARVTVEGIAAYCGIIQTAAGRAATSQRAPTPGNTEDVEIASPERQLLVSCRR